MKSRFHVPKIIYFPAVPEKEVVIVGGSTSAADSTQFYSGATNQASPTDVDCTIASYTAATGTTTDMVCDFVFGKGICCNGLKSTDATDLCLYYDCFTNSWSSIMDMPARLTYHASNVIRHKGRDEYWLLAGGQGNISYALTNFKITIISAIVIFSKLNS